MRNAGFLGGALIGLGYFVGSRKAHASEVYMAKSKPMRHTFSGAGQLEFEESIVNEVKGYPIRFPNSGVIRQDWSDMQLYAAMIRRMANNRAYREHGLTEIIDEFRKAVKDNDPNMMLMRWQGIIHALTPSGTSHYYTRDIFTMPTGDMMSKEEMFCYVYWCKGFAKRNPEIRCLTNDNQYWGSGGKLRAYSTVPPFYAPRDDDIRMKEYIMDNHRERLLPSTDRLKSTPEKMGWLDPTVIDESGKTKAKPKYLKNRYSHFIIVPPASAWPTNQQIDRWYDEIKEIYDSGVHDTGLQEAWKSYQKWMEQSSLEQPFPLQPTGHDARRQSIMRYEGYWWGKNNMEELKQFENMDGYDALVKKLKKNLRANMKMKREQLKEL